ncbi:neutral/alkaline non-lysosomal ceramidase N-terminal domain-containing protein [Corynebacterium aquatimens]
MADMTGEPLGAGMNGYAVSEQTTTGIRFRQMARAFIFVDPSGSRTLFIVGEFGLMFQSIQREVLRRLNDKFRGLYHEGNTFITATHTHTGPGGTSGHLMVDLVTMGFRPVTFEATVEGMVVAAERAHADIQESDVYFTRGVVTEAGANRSFQAFKRNEDDALELFPNGVNPESHTLHIARGGEEVGLINWYGLHATCFGHEHTLIDGDHKGWASWKMETDHGVVHRDPAKHTFVAAFATGGQGDITPNMGLVPKSGPGFQDEALSAKILGDRQIEGTNGPVVTTGGGSVTGVARVRNVHKWVDMRSFVVDGRFTADGQDKKLGPAVLGAAFAATSQEDGGPALVFNEGERGGNEWVKGLTKMFVTDEMREIHGNKEQLLFMGYVDGMIQQTLMYSITEINGVFILTHSMEPTTMAAYRMRRHVAGVLGVPIERVICQGYTSGYAHYVTTPEEYDNQDYEGGATIFGRHQLDAMIQVFDELAVALRDGTPVDPGQPAGDLTGLIPKSLAGRPGIDRADWGKKFGEVIVDTPNVRVGQKASATFAFANPNSNLRLGDGYVVITNAQGAVVADDFHANTTVEFIKNMDVVNARVTWDTEGFAPGTYTLKLRGTSRDAERILTPFEGSTTVTVHA